MKTGYKLSIYVPALLSLSLLTTSQLIGAIAQTQRTADKKAAAIDAGARATLEKMRRAYLRLNSYSATVTHQSDSAGKAAVTTVLLKFQHPAKLATSITSHRGQLTSLTDGKAFYFAHPNEKTKELRWQKYPLPPSSTGREALMQWKPAGSLFTPLLAGVQLFNEPWGQGPKSISRGPAGHVGLVEVDTVVVEYSKEKTTYFIGRKDHLVRRIAYSAGTGDRKYSLVETHSDVMVDPKLPRSTFEWKAPPGAVYAANELYASPELKVGAAPFPFEAKDLGGKPLRLSDYKGRVVLLDFWASWCGPCLREVPHARAAYEKYKSQGFEIIGISADDKVSDLTTFTRTHRMPWRQVFDGKWADSKIARLYRVNGIPFTLLIGRDGKIAAVNPQLLLLEPAIREALKK